MDYIPVNYIQAIQSRKLPETWETTAYWVIDSGWELKIIDTTGMTHISYVIRNPETFGLTTAQIQNIYADWGEKVGLEGKAREEIIKLVSKRGWMRVRHYVGRNDYWSLQVDNSQKRWRTIKGFVHYMITNKQMNPGDTAEVLGYDVEGDFKKFDFQSGGVKGILKEETMNEVIELKENKMTRLRAMLLGHDYQNIYSMGIITAENPMGQALSGEENRARNKTLEKELRSENYSYIKVQGKYGNLERPLVIQNVKLGLLQGLAVKFQQEAFIYGEVYEKGGKHGMVFSYFQQGNGDGNFQLVSKRDTFVDSSDATDFYTKFQGFKFQIPFFDDGYNVDEDILGKFSTRALSEETLAVLKKLSLDESRVTRGTQRSAWENRGVINLIQAHLLEYNKDGTTQVFQSGERILPLHEFKEIAFE